MNRLAEGSTGGVGRTAGPVERLEKANGLLEDYVKELAEHAGRLNVLKERLGYPAEAARPTVAEQKSGAGTLGALEYRLDGLARVVGEIRRTVADLSS
ncbi:MAG TPA: hypothetical protein VFF65_01510 [Phycisphaerales bacterium]|nr:hypothetical protein [Phycisphaerales bacterium]